MATALGLALNKAGVQLDTCLVRAAGLVHDIAKGRRHHASAGAALVRGFGFPRVAEVVARHMTIDFDGSLDEGAVLYLADKLIQGEERVRLEERFAPAMARFASDPDALAGVKRRYADARAIWSAVEAHTGPLEPFAKPAPSTETGASA